MSRSRKKTPITGYTTAETEKDDKRRANRKLRRITKVQVKKGDDQFTELREISNVWAFGKDGKRYLKNPTKRALRK